MQFNLKTTLTAFPKLSPSILENYVTKDELDQKDYVSHTELSTILLDFVKEVETDGTSVVYGRVKGAWVPVVDIPEQASGIMCWGMINSDILSAEQLFNELKRQNFLSGVNEYSVEDTPTSNGYFWFASTSPIKCVIADNGLKYKQNVVECPDVCITYKGENLTFHCYRTQKLVALPGVKYRFEISF